MANIGFSVLAILLLAFLCYGIDTTDLANRLGVNVTLVLTLMTFKSVLSDKLDVSYITLFDTYVLSAELIMVVQAAVRCVVYVHTI